MSSDNMEDWKDYFVKMARGEIPYSKFYIVHGNVNSIKKDTPLTLVTPVEQAVEQAKSEVKTASVRKRPYEEDPIVIRDNKRKPPGSKQLTKKIKQTTNKRQLWDKKV
jgi:hypothetical protein